MRVDEGVMGVACPMIGAIASSLCSGVFTFLIFAGIEMGRRPKAIAAKFGEVNTREDP